MPSSTKHTPGPWKRGKNGDLWVYTIGPEAKLIAKVCGHGADAQLIAAAPDLLDALSNLSAWTELYRQSHMTDCDCELCTSSKQAAEALRKASGEACR